MYISRQVKPCSLTINLVMLGSQLNIFLHHIFNNSHKPGFPKFRYLVETWISKLRGDTTSMSRWWQGTSGSIPSHGERGLAWELELLDVITLENVDPDFYVWTAKQAVVCCKILTHDNMFIVKLLIYFSSQQSFSRIHLGQWQETHLETVEVRPQHPGSGWSGEHQPAQLCHHGQLLRGQAGLHGGPRSQGQGQWCCCHHLAGTGTRWFINYYSPCLSRSFKYCCQWKVNIDCYFR